VIASSIKPDSVCANAVEAARVAALEVGGEQVGEHLGVRAETDRVATHAFAATVPGYSGWYWAVTVARPPRAKAVTVDEVVLLPGEGALLAPEWLPWSERLRPGDLGAGDLLPTERDDPRLEPGYTGFDEAEPKPLHDDPAWQTAPERDERRDTVPFIAQRLGLARVRVLSPDGRDEAALRWYEGEHGPHSAVARAAPAQCATCGFLTLLGGILGQSFGACANEYSPSDGHVVALDHGCGAHSEAAIVPATQEAAEPIVDEFAVDRLPLGGNDADAQASADESSSSEPSEPSEPSDAADPAGSGEPGESDPR
jgi:DUF3027 family protein